MDFEEEGEREDAGENGDEEAGENGDNDAELDDVSSSEGKVDKCGDNVDNVKVNEEEKERKGERERGREIDRIPFGLLFGGD